MVPRFVVGLSAILVAAVLAQKSRQDERPTAAPTQHAEKDASGERTPPTPDEPKPEAPDPTVPEPSAGHVLRVDTDRPPAAPVAEAAPRIGLPLPRESHEAVPPSPPRRRFAAHFQTCDLAHAPPSRADV